MTDNRTTELRISEPLRGFIRHQSNRAYIDGGQARWLTEIADKIDAKHEQAIAATLGSGNCARCAESMGRYADSLCDQLKERIAELLRCLENDWHIHASWDGLRKFWCVELTEEGVKLRDATHGTLTAEQVMAIAGKHQPDYCSDTHVCFDWQAIADELNARAERTCRDANTRFNAWTCSECKCTLLLMFDDYGEPTLNVDGVASVPNYCPNCGAKVIQGVDNAD